jgi:hypothetical protein
MPDWTVLATRDDLVAYFATLDASVLFHRNPKHPGALLSLQPGTAIVEFGESSPEQRALPKRIIIRSDDVEDFFAWSSTYIDGLRPLTAFIEVLSHKQAEEDRLAPNFSFRATQGLLNAVLMEGLLQSKARTRIPDAILPACQRTLSAVFYQALRLGAAPWEISDASRLWLEIRSALGAPELTFQSHHVIEFWGVISAAFTSPHRSTSLLDSVRRSLTAGAREVFWDGPTTISLPDSLDRFLRAPREERMRFIDDRIKGVSEKRGANISDAALAGYLLSLVADGDFAMWPTAATYEALPTLPLWFAFFTGVHERSNAIVFGQSAIRRIMALLTGGLVDIDAREFLVSRQARTRTSSAVDFPLGAVNVMSAWLGRDIRGWFSIREGGVLEDRRATNVRDLTETRPPTPTFAVPPEIIEARALGDRMMKLLNTVVHARPAPAPEAPSRSAAASKPEIARTDAGNSKPPRESDALFPDVAAQSKNRATGKKKKR